MTEKKDNPEPGIVPLKTGMMRDFGLREKGKKGERRLALHDYIHDNPSVLGEVLGCPDVNVVDSEKQSGGGRLDLLLHSDKHGRRYVVEIQRDEPDPSHIVRTLAYLASEQKHSKKYDHHAVIVAENIARGRFFKVIPYLNGYHIPIIAVEVKTVEKSPGKVGFVFTLVLDFDPPQQVLEEKWRNKPGGDIVVALAKKFCTQLGKGIKPYFTEGYAGVYNPKKGGRTSQCIICPRQGSISVEFYISKSSEWDERIRKVQSGAKPKGAERYYRFPVDNNTDMKKYADLWRAMYCEAAGIENDEGQTGVDDASN